MGAHVEHRFDKDFVVDEERLRKIRSIIDARLSKLDVTSGLFYKVRRGDSFSYETESIEQVIEEDNEDWRRITGLDIKLEEKDRLELVLAFSRSGVSLVMEGAERDEVFLLFSDLKHYLDNEVATCRSRHILDDKLLPALFPLGFLFFLILFMFIFTDRPEEHIRQAVLESQDLADKLNFLVEHKAKDRSSTIFSATLFATVILLAAAVAFSQALRHAYPSNDFVFGKRKELLEKRRAVIGKVFWGIGVTLVVSIVAGLIVRYFMK